MASRDVIYRPIITFLYFYSFLGKLGYLLPMVDYILGCQQRFELSHFSPLRNG